MTPKHYNHQFHGDESVADGATAHDGDKTIPFLRRLRDMLVENEDTISFTPGSHANGRKVLGRIVVHDRVQVETSVLPRYFNHSSFASLRRQLNYFSWIRLGKGRQRESSYSNEEVIVLDDILHLKRRPHSGKLRLTEKCAVSNARVLTGVSDDSSFDDNATVGSLTGIASPPVLNVSHPNAGTLVHRQNKRRRGIGTGRLAGTMTTVPPRSLSPLENHFISEDDCRSDKSKQSSIALDLTMPDLGAVVADEEVLECCKDLLQLAAGKAW